MEDMEHSAESAKPEVAAVGVVPAEARGTKVVAKKKDAEGSSTCSVCGVVFTCTLRRLLCSSITFVRCVFIVPDKLRHYEITMCESTKSQLITL